MQDQHTEIALLGTATVAARGPRIYVACLAAYNSGHLHGCWIDVTAVGDMQQAIDAMLANSPVPLAEEWAIHDHEGFEGADLAEYTPLDHVCDLAAFIAERGRLGAKLLDYFGQALDESRAAFEEYAGQYKDLADFAEELTREIGPEIPDQFQYYIDWAAMGRDMELNGDVFTIAIGLEDMHVFWSR